jgi:hypothetical protein
MISNILLRVRRIPRCLLSFWILPWSKNAFKRRHIKYVAVYCGIPAYVVQAKGGEMGSTTVLGSVRGDEWCTGGGLLTPSS